MTACHDVVGPLALLALLAAAGRAEAQGSFAPARRAGGFVYASAAQGADAGGDVKAQTRRALEALDARLRAEGSSLARAAAVNVYLRNAGDFAAMNEAYRGFFAKDPPTRTTVVGALQPAAALVEVAAVGVPDGAERRVVHPPDWIASANPYSYGIRSGDTLFLAGLVSRNGKDNSLVAGDMAAQTRTVLENGRQILAAAGLELADVVQSRVYITDTAAFQEMNGAYRAFFAKDPPVRATVKAALMNPQFLVEITMVAVKGGRQAVTSPNADGTPGTPNPNLSSAIRAGERLWTSGMLGNTTATRGDAAAQTRETLARLERALVASGFSWADVREALVYVSEPGAREAVERTWRERFPGERPAGTLVETPLVAADGLVEIMLHAAR